MSTDMKQDNIMNVDTVALDDTLSALVIIDQTIPMPDDLQRSSWGQIERFVQAGDRVKLYTFSAFLPGEYLRLAYAGQLDMPLNGEIRDDVNMRKLRNCSPRWH